MVKVFDVDTKEIDAITYGKLIQKVDHIEKKLDKLENTMDGLVDLANNWKGSLKFLWLGISLIPIISGIISHFIAQ